MAQCIMTFTASQDRYDAMRYRRCGAKGLLLPEISLGLWQNFGHDRSTQDQESIVLRAFDLGITHFDLANNYGPPPGSAEENFGSILRKSLGSYRDELIISTKAGYRMWPGPYGEWGSKKYLLSSLDQSLKRLGLDYVDIFYSHHFDPSTPLEETMGALDAAVRSGKALYAGVSSYSATRTAAAINILQGLGTPLLVHQPSYSMLNRWIEGDLLNLLGDTGVGCVAFSPLAQGMLTGKYLGGVPSTSRATVDDSSIFPEHLTEVNLSRIREITAFAEKAGFTPAQLAIAWVLRDPRVTSALIGASSIGQLEENLAVLRTPTLTADDLQQIDALAIDSGVNIWAPSSTD